MGSKLFRRGGVAVVKIAELLKWVPDTVIQVGIGSHYQEVDVMREAWPDVCFLGFEPHPGLVKKLRGKYPGSIYGWAVIDSVGWKTLYDKPRHIDGSSLFKLPDHDCKEIEVWAITLDSLDRHVFPYKEAGDRILLWLDCEGNELAALRGGEKLVGDVEIINVEMTSNPPSSEWCNMMETHRWLVAHGFKRQWVHTLRSYVGECDVIYVRKHLWDPRYCACPCSFEDQ